MGELYPPTAADYAWDSANDAKNEAERLKARVAYLERLAGVANPEPELKKYVTLEEFLSDVYSREDFPFKP